MALKLAVHTLPHTIDDLSAFIGGVGGFEAPLDGPVPKPGEVKFRSILVGQKVRVVPMGHHLVPTGTYGVDDLGTFVTISDFEFLLQENRSLLI